MRSPNLISLTIEVTDLPAGATRWSPKLIINQDELGITGTAARRILNQTSDSATFTFERSINTGEGGAAKPLDGQWQIEVTVTGDVTSKMCTGFTALKRETYEVVPDEVPPGLQVSFATPQQRFETPNQDAYLTLPMSGAAAVKVYSPATGMVHIATKVDKGASPAGYVPCNQALQIEVRPDPRYSFTRFSDPCAGLNPCGFRLERSATMSVELAEKVCTPSPTNWCREWQGQGGMNGVFGLPNGEVIAVGQGGRILIWDGLVWADQAPSPAPANDLKAVWGTYNASSIDHDRTVWIVGSDRLLLRGTRTDKTGWTWTSMGVDQATGLHYSLNAVWGRASDRPNLNDVVAVGGEGDGRRVRWVPGLSMATSSQLGSFLTLTGVWGDDNGYWIAGSGGGKGTVWRFREVQQVWEPVATPQQMGPLTGIWSPGESVWVASDGGKAWRWQSDTWTPVQVAGYTGALRAITGRGLTVWAVGDGGTVVTSDGSSAAPAFRTVAIQGLTDQPPTLRGVWTDGLRVWTVGDKGSGEGVILSSY